MSGCLESLGRGLTLESAIIALDDIPEHLQQHPAIDELKESVRLTLVQGIEELAKVYNMEGRYHPEAERELLNKAEDALAKLLGPVDRLFTGQGEASDPHDYTTDGSPALFYTEFGLPEDVLDFRPTVIRVLLQSDALEV